MVKQMNEKLINYLAKKWHLKRKGKVSKHGKPGIKLYKYLKLTKNQHSVFINDDKIPEKYFLKYVKAVLFRKNFI